MILKSLNFAVLIFAMFVFASPVFAEEESYNEDEIGDAIVNVFGELTEGLATVIEKVFSDLGEPNAYIAGSEGSGAIVIGASYGKGELFRKGHPARTVYWQGPSIGFDVGGNASKVFTLVYSLPNEEALFQRFPAVDGSLYYIGGAGVNYQRDDGITLAPIRVGVGLRAGINVGMMHFTKSRRILPF